MIKIHPSSLGLIMTDAKSIDTTLLTEELAVIYRKKSKTGEEHELLAPLWDQTLSVGAKTELMSIAKEFVYGYHQVITSKQMDKGMAVEDEAIELYNTVFFTSYAKNKERRENEWLTGEVDIFTGKKIVDIKSSWSLATFPATAEDGRDKMYEWQGRGYMMLWDCDEFENAHCMVNTPEELLRYEQRELHVVDHIDPAMRVTVTKYSRDIALEEKIKTKCEAAQKYLVSLVAQIRAEHQY